MRPRPVDAEQQAAPRPPRHQLDLVAVAEQARRAADRAGTATPARRGIGAEGGDDPVALVRQLLRRRRCRSARSRRNRVVRTVGIARGGARADGSAHAPSRPSVRRRGRSQGQPLRALFTPTRVADGEHLRPRSRRLAGQFVERLIADDDVQHHAVRSAIETMRSLVAVAGAVGARRGRAAGARRRGRAARRARPRGGGGDADRRRRLGGACWSERGSWSRSAWAGPASARRSG